jgi:hypothetical protein
MLKQRKGLVRPEGLRKKPTEKKRKYRRLEQKNNQQLRKVADECFSKAIRLRDSERKGNEWYGECISCSHNGRVAWLDAGKLRFDMGWDAGHFVKRGHLVVRFNDMNVNLQCKFHCNKMLSGNVEKQRPALMEKYGDNVPDDLEKIAKETIYYKFTRDELLEIIHDAKEEVDFYEKQRIAKFE